MKSKEDILKEVIIKHLKGKKNTHIMELRLAQNKDIEYEAMERYAKQFMNKKVLIESDKPTIEQITEKAIEYAKSRWSNDFSSALRTITVEDFIEGAKSVLK